MAGAVNAQLQNTFGMQASQNTGQLTQAAGGVGSDRVAVGQAQLANQQGLAQGQTDAALYAQAQQAAQTQQQAELGAGNSMQGLGTNVLNSQLTGANALLGTGGLQQQLSQAQLNAPYQQQLAQAAFPYQQAQFNAGITGALAPGLGGTTQGVGQTQSQYNPSLFSQILGGAGSAASIGSYLGKGSGGVVGYSRGGSANPFAFAAGGSPYSLPSGLDDQPINVDSMNIIPQESLTTAKANTPTLNLNAQQPNMQQQQSGSTGKGSNSGGLGGLTANQLSGSGGQNFLGMSNSAQDSLQDFMEGDNRGGAVNQPYQTFDTGGTPYAPPTAYGLAESGDPDTTPAFFGDRYPSFLSAGPDNAPVNALGGTGMTPQMGQAYPSGSPFNPMRMADPEAVQAWRDSTPLPDASAGIDASGNPTTAGATAAGDSTSPPGAAPTAGAGTPGAAAPAAQPSAATTGAPSGTADSGKSLAGFLKSPYAALLQASLSAFTPQGFAGGFKSGMENFQKQESIDQSAKKLAQEAQFHQDEFTKAKPYEQFEMKKPQQIGRNLYGQPVFGVLDQKTGAFVDPVTHKPVDTSQMGEADDAMIQSTAKAIANYDQPPISPYKAVTPIGMAIMNKAREINSNYDAKNYAEANAAKVKFGSGPQGDAIRSFGTAYRHIDLAERMIDAMNNGDSKLVNTLKNEWKTVFGTSAAPNNFAAAKSIVSDEIIKAVLGSRGALGDRSDAQAHLDAATSPKLLHGVIEDTYKPLMIGQLQGYKQQYEAATHGAKDFGEKLSPEVSQDLDKAVAASAAKAQAGHANPAGGGAAPAFTGRTATNPKTGQKMREIAPNQWQPVQ